MMICKACLINCLDKNSFLVPSWGVLTEQGTAPLNREQKTKNESRDNLWDQESSMKSYLRSQLKRLEDRTLKENIRGK